MERIGRDGWLEREGRRFCHHVIPSAKPQMLPALSVSGAFQTMESWLRYAQAFAPYATVLLVDPPGMGRSDRLPPEVGVDYLAGCLLQVLDSHAVERVNVIAGSYGTAPAFRLAQLHPERVERVVLGATMKEVPLHVRDRVLATAHIARRGDRALLAEEVIDVLLCRDPLRPVERSALAERLDGAPPGCNHLVRLRR